MNQNFKAMILLSFALTLSACGGGSDSGGSSGGNNGGGSGGGTPTPTLYTVTASVDGGGGSISPSSIRVQSGKKTSFTLTPNQYYEIGGVGGTCGGSLSGNTYTTNAVTYNCTVVATFNELVLEPTIEFNGSDVTNKTVTSSIAFSGTKKYVLNIKPNTPQSTVSLSYTSTGGLDVNGDNSGNVTVSTNENAVIGGQESFTVSVTNDVGKSASLTFNMAILESGAVAVDAFCLKGYCNGETPETYVAGGSNYRADVHFQAVFGAAANFSYEINSDFGDIESVVVSVFNKDNGVYVGDAFVKHDDYLKEIQVYTDQLIHDEHVRLEFTVMNELGESQVKDYDVFYKRGYEPAGSVIHPFTKVNVVRLNQEYSFSGLKRLNDGDYSKEYKDLDILSVYYGSTYYDSTHGVEVEWSYVNDVFKFTVKDPKNLININDKILAPFRLIFRYNVVDESGNSPSTNLTHYADAPFLLTLSDDQTLIENIKEAEDIVIELVKLTSSELELDMVLNFWIETFEANGYQPIQPKYVVDAELKQLNKKLIHDVGTFYRMVYGTTLPSHHAGVSFESVVDYDRWEELVAGWLHELNYGVVDFKAKTRKSSLINSASYKVNLINQHVSEYNALNGTNYGLILNDVYNMQYPYVVPETETYSLLVGNTNYGSYVDGVWVFNDAYSYLSGVNSNSIKMFYQLIR